MRNRYRRSLLMVTVLLAAAFGVFLHALRRALEQQSLCGSVLAMSANGIAGYVLLRLGSQALYLGPVVAQSPGAGRLLLDALVARSDEQSVFLDVPDRNAAASE